MERLPRGRYTKEFRLEAAKLVIEGGLSACEVGRQRWSPEFGQSYTV